MRSILLLFILGLLASCAKTPEEKTVEAIDVAQTYLSESKCDEAIQVLEDIGMQNEDAVYLQVLASAYACRGGVSEITFISTDIGRLQTGSANALFRSLTTFSLSDETSTDSDGYKTIRTALGIIFNADGGAQPSQENREAFFGPRKAGDLGLQALILTIIQLGKFLNHFGNTNAIGAKGLGPTNTNTCFIDYTTSNSQALISALPAANNCNSNSDGHPDLDLMTDAGKRRACEGLMLMNNLLDILNNIDLSGDESLSDLEEVAAFASGFKTVAVAANPSLSTLLETTSQSVCEDLMGDTSERDNMELVYAYLFETGLQ